MAYTGEFQVYEDIIQEMSIVYQHDKRPWMIGFSGGKDSTLLCCLVMEMLQRLAPHQRHKTVYIVSSDTMVENPIVKNYMHRMSAMINATGKNLKVKADIIYPEVADTFWSRVIGLGYPTPEAPGRLQITQADPEGSRHRCYLRSGFSEQRTGTESWRL